MNRIEFMTKLASLLQDVPAEERREAMKYYNDYFDDAGVENEEQVIRELGSPEKVAAMLKEGIEGYDENESPLYSYAEAAEEKKERWTSKPLKVILIIAIALCAAPVIVPVVIGIIAAAAGILLALVCAFIAIVIAAAAVAISGIAISGIGIVHLFSEFAVGLALTGIGLIILPLGAIAVAASIKLCMVVFPGIIRGIVWILRKPFQRKAVA